MHKPLRTLVSSAVLGVLATSAAQAGGFSLYTEGGVVAVENYAAGIAAEAADASIGWYNPAGLVLVKKQEMVSGGVGVFPISKITGSSTYRVTSPAASSYTQTFDALEGAKEAFVPSFHYARPINDRYTVGLSIVSPFGLATQWGQYSPVRYEATLTELMTVNASPQIGAKLTDNFSAGVGLDVQYAKVKFNRVLGAPTTFASANPLTAYSVDTLSYNKGDSWGVGFHLGLMGMFNDNHTRIGLNYQSQMRHTFEGSSTLSGRLANTVGAGGILNPNALNPNAVVVSDNLTSNPINFPDIVTLSGYHDVNQKLALLGSLVWTGWSTLQTIQLNNVAAPSVSALGAISQITVNSVSSQNYRDTWRFALGANYQLTPAMLIRVGGGWDQTPTNDVDRDIRLADVDRWALSIGGHYDIMPNLGVDVGYTHLFATEDPVINRTDALTTTSSYTVNATANVAADLIGAQVVWIMDKPLVVSKK